MGLEVPMYRVGETLLAMRLFPPERGHWASTVDLRVEQN